MNKAISPLAYLVFQNFILTKDFRKLDGFISYIFKKYFFLIHHEFYRKNQNT